MSKTAKIDSFFGKQLKKEESVKPTAPVVLESTPPSKFDAFYASLTPAQRLAHSIAKEKLGSSYNVVRTHDYIAYQKK